MLSNGWKVLSNTKAAGGLIGSSGSSLALVSRWRHYRWAVQPIHRSLQHQAPTCWRSKRALSFAARSSDLMEDRANVMNPMHECRGLSLAPNPLVRLYTNQHSGRDDRLHDGNPLEAGP